MTQPENPVPALSVVLPVYNERENLEPLLEELTALLPRWVSSWEILFVDDGSTDGGSEALDRLRAIDTRVRVLHLRENRGQSAAMDAGFRAARAELVVTLDADLQNDPADIGTLLAELPHADVVCGMRVNRHDSWVRRVSSRIANAVRNSLTGESIRDTGCSLKLYRTAYLRRIKMFRGMHRFLPTLLRYEGARVVEVPVNHRPRRHGASKYGIRNRALSGLLDCLAVRWMRTRRLDYQLRDARGEGEATELAATESRSERTEPIPPR